MSENLTMDDLPAYDTPEMPDQEEAAEYDGETVTLYDPWRLDDDEKNYAVYVRDPDTGNVNKLKFGSGDMEIKRDQPERLKAFRERFSCDEYGQSDKHEATFWSCLFWRKDLSVSDILSEDQTMTESEVREIVREELREAGKTPPGIDWAVKTYDGYFVVGPNEFTDNPKDAKKFGSEDKAYDWAMDQSGLQGFEITKVRTDVNMGGLGKVKMDRLSSGKELDADDIEKRLYEVAGGPWENIRHMVYTASQKGLVQDIGKKGTGDSERHEFAVAGRIFVIKELD